MQLLAFSLPSISQLFTTPYSSHCPTLLPPPHPAVFRRGDVLEGAEAQLWSLELVCTGALAIHVAVVLGGRFVHLVAQQTLEPADTGSIHGQGSACCLALNLWNKQKRGVIDS